jgi:PAS domain S-box-containing protein
MEVVHYHKSGRKYWAVIDVQVVQDEAGGVVKYISIERDITSRKLADAALRQNEARLKEAQQLAHIGSFENDLTQNEPLFSEEALRIHELTSPTGHVSWVQLAGVIHPDDLANVKESRAQALASNGSYSLEHRLLFPDGRLKYVHTQAAVHAGQDGKPSRIVGTVQDITEQKLAEQALVTLNETLEHRVLDRTHELEQQRTFIETILNTAESLIFVIDYHGRFVRFNGALERLTGYSFEELRGQPIWESVIPPERRAEVRAKHEDQTAPDKLTRTLEVEWLTRAGQRRLIAWSNAVLTDESGKLKYMIGTGIDISERKLAELALIEANQHLNQTISKLRQTQSQLVQAEKMASLGGLVAGISHEINTPIGIGVTSSTALQEEFVVLRREFEGGAMKRSTLERFIAHGMNGCEILVSNLMRAADLVRSFKQVAVDQSSDEWRRLILHDYIDEIVLSLQPKLKGRKIQVLNASNPALAVYTHPGAIYQILSNLLINSLVHAYEPDQSGVIRIAAEQVGDEIQMDFSDDGKGIALDIQGRIFDPFFTTRRGSGGSGLGLHIVFNLVASTLNGGISLVKDVTQGSTFRIRFPMHLESERP